MIELDIAIDKNLKRKYDLMIDRVIDSDEQDNYIIFEGDGGSGKTNASVVLAYLVSKKTGRSFNEKNIFFDTSQAVDFAKKTREQIIIFDEPVFSGLKAEWRKKTQIDLIKLLFTARYKRHFVIFNLIKFNKFSDDIIEKAIALIRIYKRDESKRTRRFLYIPHKRIGSLLNDFRRLHKRNYMRYKTISGNLHRYVMPEIINMEIYNKMKDDAVMTIGEVEGTHREQRHLEELIKLRYMISQVKIKTPITSQTDFYDRLGLKNNNASRWGKYVFKYPEFISKIKQKDINQSENTKKTTSFLPLPDGNIN